MYDRKWVFAAACLGMLLFGIGLITLGSMATDLRLRFNLDEVQSGTLFSILPIGILAGSLCFGPVCDRYGYKVLLIISCVGMCIGFEGIAYASSLPYLNPAIFLFGLCGGIMNGATNSLVSDISVEAKGANLSILGVFFGIGALGMPFVQGLLKNYLSSFSIVSLVGWFTLAVALFFGFIKFPPSKKGLGFPLTKTTNLFKDRFLYFIAFYLFFQGSLEAIGNNWTTTYLTKHLAIKDTQALYALTLFVAGLTAMRLLIGSAFRNIKPARLMAASLGITFIGIALIHFGGSFPVVLTGLILLGFGLAGGFPIMLGIAGNRYAAQSGTAFSLILTIALLGNTMVNLTMGWVAKHYGIGKFTSFAALELLFMIIFCVLIFRKEPQKMQDYAGNSMVK